MRPKILIIVLAFMFLTACNHPIARKNEINKIEIADGGCLRRCPVFAIMVDSSLTYRYYGGYNAQPKGCYEGQVSHEFWDTLNTKLKQINFQKLDTSGRLPLDGESAEAIFYWNGKKRHVYVSMDRDANEAAKVFRWILNSYKHIQLSRSTDSISFAATFQYIRPPEPPKPKVDQIKFPPPPKYRKK